MMPDPLFYQLLLVGLVWLCLMLHVVWPSDRATAGRTTPRPAKAPRKRSHDLKPFPGLTREPPCAACVPATPPRAQARPPAPGGHVVALLPPYQLRLSGLGRVGQYQCQRSPQRRPLAPAALQQLWRLLPGDPWHAVAWQARGAREAGVGGGRAGGGLGHPCRGPRV